MTAFKNRIQFFVQYFFLWIAYFFFARILFLLFHYSNTLQLGIGDTLKTFLYGFRLDASFTAYLSIVPFLLIASTLLLPKKVISIVLKGSTYFAIILMNLVLMIDASLYQSWGIRVDATLLNYLNTPELMWASASTFQLLSGSFLWIVLSIIFIRNFQKIIQKQFQKLEKGTLAAVPFLFLVIAALIIPIRGGLQVIPINQSNVYFSKNMFGNHAAVNFMWNFTHSVYSKVSTENPYQKFAPSIADKIIHYKEKK